MMFWREVHCCGDGKLREFLRFTKLGIKERCLTIGGVIVEVEYKLLTSIMAGRLRELVEKKGILRESQAGFRSEGYE